MSTSLSKANIWDVLVIRLLKILLPVFLFLYVFDIPFTFLPYNTGVFMAIIGWGWWILKIITGRPVIVNKNVLLILSVLALLTGYAYLYIFARGTHDIHVPRLLLLFFLIIFPAGDALAEFFARMKYDINDVLYLFVKIFVVQAFMMYAMFLIPPFKQWVFSVMRDGEGRIILNGASLGFRGLGICYGVTWDLALLQSMGLIFIVLLINYKNRILLGIFYLILVGSIFIAGRTGFIGMGFSFVLFFYQLKSFERSKIKAAGRFVRNIVITAIALMVLIYNMLSDDIKLIITDSLLPFAFELFMSKGETGSFETASSNELKTMYFPVSTETLLIGDGYYDDPDDPSRYYMGTDAGYMRQMLFYGLAGSLLFYFFYIALFLYMTYHFNRKFGHIHGMLVFILLVYFMVAHVKGDLLLGGDMPIRVIFLLFFYVVKMKLPETRQESLAITN